MNKLKTAIAACLCAAVVSAWGEKKPTTERWLDPNVNRVNVEPSRASYFAYGNFKDAQGNTTESAFSNTATISTSIEAIENAIQASSYNVYTLDGKAVMLNAKSLKGLQKGVYIVNDHKVVLK